MIDEKHRLIDKSVESFILGIEIYNKPTLHYRVEGFSFFIVNAWELMLKAELLNRKKSIYYKNKPDRTLGISDVIKKIYSNRHTRIRLNLEKIVELRNIGTHYITEDYELKYTPLFQACVINFVKEIMRFHDVDITKKIPSDFLTIRTNISSLRAEEINAKYSPQVATKFLKQARDIDSLSREYNSDKFSINFKQNLFITRKKDNADFTIFISKDSTNSAAIIKDLKDPANTHPHSFTAVIAIVSDRLTQQKIALNYKNGFTSHILCLIIDFYKIKSDKKYVYRHVVGKAVSYTYSQQFVDFIIDIIKKDPCNFVESLKKR